jgi:oligopeptidase A
LRKAIEATQAERVAFELKMGQSKPIYNAVMAVRNNPAQFDKLNPVQQRIVNLTVKDFQTSGVGLEPEKRKQYNAIIDRLSKLNTNYSNNVLDSTAVRLWGTAGAGGGGHHRVGVGEGMRAAWVGV